MFIILIVLLGLGLFGFLVVVYLPSRAGWVLLFAGLIWVEVIVGVSLSEGFGWVTWLLVLSLFVYLDFVF